MSGSILVILAASAFIAASGFMFYHYVGRVAHARAWLSRGAILVDVDSAGEFARHHPRLAVSIPLASLARRAHEIGGREQPIVVFAHSWTTGARAVHLLRGMGFWEVMSAAGLVTKERVATIAGEAASARADAGLVELAPDGPPVRSLRRISQPRRRGETP